MLSLFRAFWGTLLIALKTISKVDLAYDIVKGHTQTSWVMRLMGTTLKEHARYIK